VEHTPLQTVKEVLSTTNTPVGPLTAKKVKGVDESQILPDLEKRLPTLPNSPSSVYPPSTVDVSPSQRFCAAFKNLQSHFSSTTIETGSTTDSYIDHEVSHFSDWTCGTTRFSAPSEYAPSIIDLEPMSPPTDGEFEFGDVKTIDVVREAGHEGVSVQRHAESKQEALPSAISSSTISSVASSVTPSSHVGLTGAKEASFGWNKFQHYSLPTEDAESGATLKPTSTSKQVAPLVLDENHRPEGFAPQVIDGSGLPHSTGMQELLDELSYLGGMIQHH
jgi:hypothetical protein